MGEIVARHMACLDADVCGSSDALSVYEDELDDGGLIYSAHCFSCNSYFKQNDIANSYLGEELEIGPLSTGGSKKSSGSSTGRNMGIKVKQKPKIYLTDEQEQHILATTYIDTTNFRKIARGVNEKFKVRTEYNADGEIVKRYYPTYDEHGKLAGYKLRTVLAGKNFYSQGYTGKETKLFGQNEMSTGGNYLFLTSGEEDAMAAYEILARNQHKRGYDPIACVSPSTSESAAVSNVQFNYEFLDKFDKIIIGFDNDKVGEEYAKKVAEVCPPAKAYIMTMPVKPPEGKDPSDCKMLGKEKQFLSAFYAAEKYKPEGITGSNELTDSMIEELSREKIPLPPFATKLEKALAGGIPLGYIVNIGSASGSGKTTIINELIYHWLFHSPHKVGIVSLELSKGQYGIAMLSRHLSRKIQLFETPQEAIDFVQLPENKKKADTLWLDESGDPRFYLMDERDGSIEDIKKQINQLIISCGCKVIILDPLQDILDSSTNEEQAAFMKYQKAMVKTGVTFININHVRKSGTGEKSGSQGKDLVEEDFAGSSTIFKSGGINILCMRDKYSEDAITKNTTRVVLSKNRGPGITGPLGEWYYDINTHTLHDKELFFATNTIEDSIPQCTDDIMDEMDNAVIQNVA